METSDPATWTAPEYPRADEPFTGPERAMLDGFLDWHRASLLRRCTGLTGQQLTGRPVLPSNLSLLGIVRHLTDVERTYFRRRWGGEDIVGYYFTPDRPDGLVAAGRLTRCAAGQGNWTDLNVR